ncbi:MAG: hypothetical protein OXC01_00600 [Immundisolibacterales bacterium]|nr:hypothetical protein [Immundisolibacterales bacterium]
MSLLFYFYLAAICAAVLLATVAIWAPRRTAPRAASVALAVAVIPASYAALTEILGKPKPVAHEWWSDRSASAVLLGTSVDEGRAIYLWVHLDGETRPRYYELPWRRTVAERIQEVTDEAIRTRGRIEIKDLFSSRAWDNLGFINIEIAPPSAPPLKPPPPPARMFDPRGDVI